MNAFGRTAYSCILATGNVVMLCDISRKHTVVPSLWQGDHLARSGSKGIRPKPGSCILSDASGPFVGDRSELDPHNRRGLQLTTIVVRWDLSNLCV